MLPRLPVFVWLVWLLTHTIIAMVTNTVPGILVTVVTKVYIPVVTFATKVTSVDCLLWLCECATVFCCATFPVLFLLILIF
jgi:hypothetical protein